MTPRKRAPGGGRKPKGPAPMRSQLTIRIPEDTRTQLEAAARRNRKTLSDELLWRLRSSFSRERDERRDPAMRGLCHLIAELAHHVVGIHAAEGISRYEVWDWRSDAFFYRAFKVAVIRLLDALEPTGPIKAHDIVVAKGIELDSFTKRYIGTFKRPETRAEQAVDFILAALRTAPRMTEEELKQLEATHPSIVYPFYGITDAARDLAVKPQGEMVPVRINMGLSLTGETIPVTVNIPQSSFEELKRREEPKS
jgi:hypothetical protein